MAKLRRSITEVVEIENKAENTELSLTGITATNVQGAISEIKTSVDANTTNRHTHSNKTVIDGVTAALVTNWNAAYTHISDSTKHITAAERATWNGKGNAKDGLYTVVGTQTASTSAWTGSLSDVASLYDGLTIAYWLPIASTSTAVTLNLTLSSGETGAINCYYRGTTRLTTHYSAGNLIVMTYCLNRNISGTAYTGWWAHGQYDTTYSTITEAEIDAGTSTSARVVTAARLAYLSTKILAQATPVEHVGSTGSAHGAATTSVAGFMSSTDKTKLDGIATGATKVEKSTTNGNIKINGTETVVYTHPTGTNPHGTTKSDVGLGNVTNESKATMFTSPAFTGIPTAPTAASGTNTTQIATTAFVQAAMGSAGAGDMTKAVYDTNNNGIVDNAEKIDGIASTSLALLSNSTSTIQALPTIDANLLGGFAPSYFATQAQITTINDKLAGVENLLDQLNGEVV